MIPSLKSLALLACMQRSVSEPAHEYLKQYPPSGNLFNLSILLHDNATVMRDMINNFLILQSRGNSICLAVAQSLAEHQYASSWDILDAQSYQTNFSRLRAFELHMETVFCVNEPLAREVQKFLKDFNITLPLPLDQDQRSFLRHVTIFKNNRPRGNCSQVVFDHKSNSFENKMILQTFKRAMQ